MDANLADDLAARVPHRGVPDRARIDPELGEERRVGGAERTLSAVIGDALELLLEKEDPARRAARREKKELKPSLRDAVLARDGCRCVHPGCGETRWLELDHIVPAALGGKTTFENLRTYCRRHNQEAAIAVFGAANVEAAKRAAGRASRR